MKISEEMIARFKRNMIENEKARASVEKYVRDVRGIFEWARGGNITKEKLIEYKKTLTEKYAPSSVNSIIASLNCFFEMFGHSDFRLKGVKLQRKIFEDKSREITREEYLRLLKTAKKHNNERMYYLMQTICSTGIRVSEIKFVTVEAIRQKSVVINCKGKMRVVILPNMLCKMLKDFAKKQRIKKGCVFVTRSGKCLDRSNIWREMKSLCRDAGVGKRKVFPHNLRHLFAREYYSVEKDIVRLADILGHSSINTTRIYTIENGDVHRKQIERLKLLKI